MDLRKKIFAGFLIPAALACLGFSASYLFLVTLRGDLEALRDKDMELTARVWEMKLHAIQVQQRLNDISATRGWDGFDNGFDEAALHHKAFLENLAYFEENTEDSHLASSLGSLESAFENYYENGVAMAQAYVSGGAAEGNMSRAAFDDAASLPSVAALSRND